MPESSKAAASKKDTQAMSRQQAAAVAEWTVTGKGLKETPDEQVLFRALRTCARLAGRDSTRRLSGPPNDPVWEERWQKLRSYLVETNMGLAYSVVHRVGSRKVNEDDLLSDALLGLTRAVDQFNPYKGYRFSTYACTVIARDLMRRCKRETSYRKLFPVQHEVKLERPTTRTDTGTELYLERLQRVLDGNVGNLTELESRILAQRFPEDPDSRLTFLEIGASVGLSKERVRQIQNIALDKLRKVLSEDPVLQYC
ncbi:MAG TPA: sigma-70 family RNA polymerase sigma factor [Phycisphaerae bacterium]|nr:sigma-70 family RNA polymerase sigma factor [Phycisphaerae bacterium]